MLLPENRRQQLDGIIQKMIANKESDENIQFVVKDFTQKYQNEAQPPSTAPKNFAEDTMAEKATFPATGTESRLGIAAKTIGNIPASGLNFAKNTLEFFNPLNTLRTLGQIPEAAKQTVDAFGGDTGKAILKTAKEIPGQAAKALVPQFIQHIFKGDTQKAAATLENDPVGQILPLILLGRGIAEKTGNVAAFDKAISTAAKPVTVPAKIVGNAAGSVVSQILGTATGAGASSIREGFKATPEFRQALRGQTTPDEVVSSVHDAVNTIREARHDTYIDQLKKIGEDTKSHDISPVIKAVDTNLKKFNIRVKEDGSLDFSRSSIANNGSARADVQGVFDTVKDWGSQAGDRTGIGLDTLKKQLGDFYSPSSQARAFVQSIKGSVSDILHKEVPGYTKLTSDYQKASNLLDDIRSATGAGGTAKADTVFTKLSQAMKGDKEFRLEVLRQIETTGGQSRLMDKIAGIQLAPVIPRGLVGKGADVGAAFTFLAGHFNPSFIPALLATSPRIVGEFINALGVSAKAGSKIAQAVNKLTPHRAALALPATIQTNTQPQETKQKSQSSKDSTIGTLGDVAMLAIPGGIEAKAAARAIPKITQIARQFLKTEPPYGLLRDLEHYIDVVRLRKAAPYPNFKADVVSQLENAGIQLPKTEKELVKLMDEILSRAKEPYLQARDKLGRFLKQ